MMYFKNVSNNLKVFQFWLDYFFINIEFNFIYFSRTNKSQDNNLKILNFI